MIECFDLDLRGAGRSKKINGQAATSYPAKTRKADDSQLEGHRQGKSFDTTHVTYRVGLKWRHATKPALYKSVSLSQYRDGSDLPICGMTPAIKQYETRLANHKKHVVRWFP